VAATTGVSELRFSPGKAVAYMLAAGATLTVMDAGIKWLTADYPVPQIAFMRYAIGFFVAAGLAARMGGLATLRTRRLGGHALRSILNLGTMLTFYYSLQVMPLADTIAIGYAAPLCMTALSVPLLKERVGWRRWSAIAVGFVGVVFMLQPSPSGISAGALLALAAAVLYALTLITSRQLSSTESSHTILFYYSVGVLFALGTVGLLPPLGVSEGWVAPWVAPRWHDLWIVLSVGLLGSFGQFFLNQAFRYGEVSLLAPLDYTALIWALLLGLVLWGNFPTATVLVGAAIIVFAGLYVVRREAVLRRADRQSRAG
jgi:drug/metabolite transporter (DMT)-like permease